MNVQPARPNIEPRERIIVALDFDSSEKAKTIVDELRGEVGAFKIGLQLFTSAGPKFVRELTANGHRIFLDLKFHDIPNTVAKAAVEAARLGVSMFNVHSSGGGEMMRRTVDEVAKVCEQESLLRPKIIAVTVLTSSDNNSLRETGIEADVETQVVNLARLTAKYGLDGVVASPRESALIKQAVGEHFLVVTPGIRSTSATNDDQKRVTTAAVAIANGSDYVVIGRPITEAVDKRKAVQAFAQEIAEISRSIPDLANI